MDRFEIPAVYRPIFDRLLPEWEELFTKRASDYGDTFLFLGSKGQFSDMYRKIRKLHRSVWLGKPLLGEQAPEIIMDLIGNCFLMLLTLEEEKR